MSYCGDTCAVKGIENTAYAVSLLCRAWTCPECNPGRQAQLIAECLAGVPTVFLTLTLRRIPGRTPEQAGKALSRAWRLLRLRIMRARKMRKLPFAAVMEAHQSGYPHLHILLRSVWIDKAWLSAQMADIADSPIVDIRKIDHAGKVAGYVAKYCGKAAHRFGNCKRYWFSRDWRITPRKPWKQVIDAPGKWQVEKVNLNSWIAFKRWAGWSIEYLTRKHVKATK